MDKFNRDAMTHVTPPDPAQVMFPWRAQAPQRTAADVIANPWARQAPISGGSLATNKLPEAPTSSPAATAVAVRAADEGAIGQGGDFGGGSEDDALRAFHAQALVYPRYDGGSNGASILDNVPTFAAARPQQSSDGLIFDTTRRTATGGGGGYSGGGNAGQGLFSPEADRNISALDSQINRLMGSNSSIFDMWRGRQLMKRRDQAMARETDRAGARTSAFNANTNLFNANTGMYNAQTGRLTADVGAQRAANEVPLALMKNATDVYGIDTQSGTTQRGQSITARIAEIADATHRYGIDETAKAAQRRDEYGVLTQLPKVVQGEAMKDAYARGDMQGVRDAALLGTAERTFPERAPVPDGQGGWMVYDATKNKWLAIGANGLPKLTEGEKAGPGRLDEAKGR